MLNKIEKNQMKTILTKIFNYEGVWKETHRRWRGRIRDLKEKNNNYPQKSENIYVKKYLKIDPFAAFNKK